MPKMKIIEYPIPQNRIHVGTGNFLTTEWTDDTENKSIIKQVCQLLRQRGKRLTAFPLRYQ
jgi:hypothetical protein